MIKLDTKKQAFSLIEIIVVTALVAIITVVVSAFLSQSIKTYRIKRQSVELGDKAATVMRKFEQNTRAASKIVSADENELIFLRYFDLTSPSPTQVRYYMDGNAFKIGLTEPVGSGPSATYPSGNEETDLIVDDVVNANLIFKYFDGTGGELPVPVDIAQLRMTGLSISLDKNGSLPPGAITETTKITLRNMKDNL